MKYLIFLFIFSINFNSYLSAQDNKFGIIGGGNYSILSGDLSDNDSFEYNRRFSFHLGGVVNFNLNDKFVFSPRIIYSSQGYNATFNFSNFDAEFTTSSESEASIRDNYLNIPFLFKFYPIKRFGINFGPQIGFLLNSVTAIKEDGEESERNGGSGEFKIDYGGLVGVSYQLNQNFVVELGYYQGFSNVTRSRIGDFKNNYSVYQLSLAYLIF